MKSLLCLCPLLLAPIVGLAQEAPPAPKENQQAKLNELLMKVQDRIEADPMLQGVMLTGATFVPKMTPPGEELRLQGKLMDPAQGATVKAMVEKALGEDPYWREGEGPLEVTTTTMIAAPGSLPVANSYYAQGLEYFWKGQYAEADRAFARSLAELPGDYVLQYWRAVAALAQGQDDRAKSKLHTLLQADVLGSRSPNVAAAMERLQGPLRQRLAIMENQVLSEL
jgi:hypothetical protein